jgi:2-polyprenyl-3-methyl-5-hydroxy-6-metoxy-1,4-benzoquinol methylase
VDRKYAITELRRCAVCRLQYRAPADSAEDNHWFYQQRYASGSTTALPDAGALARLKANGFATDDHGYRGYAALLAALGLGRGHRVFEYGCSWGYGSWQLANVNGFEVVAYDVSAPRAAFARRELGVDVVDAVGDVEARGRRAKSFDCFLAAHVIEHVPRPTDVIDLAAMLLKPGGTFVAITPNGSADFRAVRRSAWHRAWGRVHPNLIDEVFWRQALGGRPILIDTSPVDGAKAAAFAGGGPVIESQCLDGGELVCVARF